MKKETVMPSGMTDVDTCAQNPSTTGRFDQFNWNWEHTRVFFTDDIEAARQAGMLSYEEWLQRLFIKITKRRQCLSGGIHEEK